MIGSELVLVWILGSVGAGALCPLCNSPPDGIGMKPGAVTASMAAVPADTTHVRLAIEGMTCGGCALTAKIILKRIPGVFEASVSYDSASAVVVFDPAVTSPKVMIEQLDQMAGYSARVVEGPQAIGVAKPEVAAKPEDATDRTDGQ